MTGEELGRRSLTLDAAYCAGASAILIVAGGPLGRSLGLPKSAIRAAGVATGAWAGVVARLAGSPNWRPSVGAVATANVLAATGIAAFGAMSPRRVARTLLTAVAAEVGAFAASQFVALHRADQQAAM